MYNMKDSGIEWIGEIPTHWKIPRVKHLFNVGRGRVISVLDFIEDGKYPVYSSQTENNGCFGYIDTYDYKGPSITWTTDGAKAGTVFYRDGKYNCTNVCGIMRLKKQYLLSNRYDYLTYVISVAANENKRADINGYKIMSNEMLNIKIPQPPIKEQQIIANCLNQICGDIDSLKNDIDEQVCILNEYKKSIITEVMTKGLNQNSKFKNSKFDWIDSIPTNWNVIPLKYVLKMPLKYGASESGVEYDENLPRYIRITDITSDGKLKDEGKLSLTENQANGYILNKKCVLFARSGATVGKTFLYKPEYGKSAFAGYLISAILDENKMLTEWLSYYTISHNYWEWVNRIFTQSTIQNIAADKYAILPITYPPIEEQKEIVEYLDKKCEEIDSIIETKKQQIEILEEYKKSIIYEYVTGKRTV